MTYGISYMWYKCNWVPKVHFSLFHSAGSPFWVTGILRKYIEWLETFKCQKYPAYTKNLPLGHKFWSVYSKTNHFRNAKLWKIRKIRNAPNDLSLTLNTWQSKVPCILQHLPTRFNFGPFCSMTIRFWDTILSESGKIGSAPNDLEWPWTDQKYPVHTKYFPPLSRFWSVLLYNQPFSRHCTLVTSPLTIILNVQKQNKKNIKNSNFQIS